MAKVKSVDKSMEELRRDRPQIPSRLKSKKQSRRYLKKAGKS